MLTVYTKWMTGLGEINNLILFKMKEYSIENW